MTKHTLDYYLAMVKPMTKYSCVDVDVEAQLRNTALVKIHGCSIPPYALWYGDYIGTENECLMWWKEFFMDIKIDTMDDNSIEWFFSVAKNMVVSSLNDDTKPMTSIEEK